MRQIPWLERMLKHPPRSLSTLESCVGALDVDFAGDEGMGSVVRDVELAGEGAMGRGAVRPEIRILWADFLCDLHHEDPHRPRDMSLTTWSMRLAIPHAEVARLLEAELGAGRALTSNVGRSVVEYGTWFYLNDLGGNAHLAYEVRQPEWAIPPVPQSALEDLLHALHDRLICDDALATIHAALAPLACAAGAELRDRTPGQIDLAFRPAIPLALVLEALRWTDPVASSSDLRLTSWRVYPNGTEWMTPHVKQWFVEVRLADWPRGPDHAELPALGRAGASPLYDLRTCVTPVTSITVLLVARAREATR
jgi:hypothetical protein